MRPGRGGGAGGWRCARPRVRPRHQHGEAFPAQGNGTRRAGIPAGRAGCPGRLRSAGAPRAVTEVIDDAPGIVHPGGAAGRGVVHDPAGEGRGGLVQAPGCPPRPRVAVPGTLQPAGEEVGGSGDRQGHPRGQGPGESPDADVEPDLGPVVPGCLPDRREELPRGPADPGHPLPFRGVAVPPGAGVRLRGGLVQQPAGVRPGGRVRAGGGGEGAACGCGQAQDIPQAAKAARISLKSPCAAAGASWAARGGGLACCAASGTAAPCRAPPPLLAGPGRSRA